MSNPAAMTTRLGAMWLLAAWVVVSLASPASSAGLSATRALDRGNEDQGVVHQVKAKRKPARIAPAVIQDIRVGSYPDYVRLVFDLQRSVTFTQSRQGNERVIIELQNALLAKGVKSKMTSELPEHVAISQPHPRSVTIALNLEAVGDYRLLPLTEPDRLVLDIYTRATEPPPGSQASAGTESAAAPRPTTARPGREIKTIVIDPGHGGKDPGAIGKQGTAEKDITLRVALLLRDLIKKRLDKQVLLTRDKDVFVELEDRAKYANSISADLFVSIHVNSHPQRATRGVEIYHFGEASDRRALEVAARENGTPIKDGIGWQYLVADLLTTRKVEESLELAWTTKQAMVAHLDGHYDVVDHGVKTAPFYVLRFTAMPSILAEIAFISNPTEERLMRNDAFLSRMAEALFEGLKAFIEPVQTAAS